MGDTTDDTPKGNDSSNATNIHRVKVDRNTRYVLNMEDQQDQGHNQIDNHFKFPSGNNMNNEWECDDQIDTDDELEVGNIRIDSAITSDVNEKLESGLNRRRAVRRVKDLDFNMYPMHNPNIPAHDLILDVGMKFGSKEEARDVILSIMVASKHGMHRDYKVKK